MTDTPPPTPPLPETPSASSLPPTSGSTPTSASSRRWDWRPKARWFAAEYLIVVLGVLTAVGINAWWQGQQNAQRERAYLSEIGRDLGATERSLQDAIEGIQVTRDATSALIRAAYVPDTVPRDSLARWQYEAQYISIPTYRMGTARALIETGDLQLIREDSTRIALSRLVDTFQRSYAMQQNLVGLILPGLVGLRKRTATTDLYTDLRRLSSGVRRRDVVVSYIESHAQSFPADGQLSFAEDYADLLNDADAFRDWRDLSDHLLVMQVQYRRILEAVQQTREQVEAELNR